MSNQPSSAVVTPITRKSHASRSADQNLGVKAEVKVTTSPPRTRKSAAPKAAAPKVTVKKVAAPKTPSMRAGKNELGSQLIKSAADFALKVKVPAGMTRDDVVATVSQWMSYIPGQMDSRLTASSAGGRRTV